MSEINSRMPARLKPNSTLAIIANYQERSKNYATGGDPGDGHEETGKERRGRNVKFKLRNYEKSATTHGSGTWRITMTTLQRLHSFIQRYFTR